MYRYTPSQPQQAAVSERQPADSPYRSAAQQTRSPMERDEPSQTQAKNLPLENPRGADIKQFMQQYYASQGAAAGGTPAGYSPMASQEDPQLSRSQTEGTGANSGATSAQVSKLVQVATLQKSKIEELQQANRELQQELKDYKRMVVDRNAVKVQDLLADLETTKKENEELKEKVKTLTRDLKKTRETLDKKDQSADEPGRPTIKEHNAVKSELSNALDECKTLRSDLAHAKKQLSDANATIREMRTTHQVEMREAQDRCTTELNERRSLQTVLETNHASYEEKLVKVRQSLQAAEKEMWNMNKEYSDYLKKATQRNEMAMQYARDCEKRRKLAEDALKEMRDQLAKENGTKKHETAALALKETEYQTRIMELEGRIKLIESAHKDEKTALANRMERAMKEAESLTTEVKLLRSGLEDETKRAETQRKRASELEQRARELRNSNMDLQEDVRVLEERVQALEGRLTLQVEEAEELEEEEEEEPREPEPQQPTQTAPPPAQSVPQSPPMTASYSPLARSVMYRQSSLRSSPMLLSSMSSPHLMPAQNCAERDEVVQKRMEAMRASLKEERVASQGIVTHTRRALPLPPVQPAPQPVQPQAQAPAQAQAQPPVSPAQAERKPRDESPPAHKPAPNAVRVLPMSGPSSASRRKPLDRSTEPIPEETQSQIQATQTEPYTAQTAPYGQPQRLEPAPVSQTRSRAPAQNPVQEQEEDADDFEVSDEEDAQYSARRQVAAQQVAAHRAAYDDMMRSRNK